MEPRLLPVNASLALVLGGGNWPTPLADAGYRLFVIEYAIGEVVADLVLTAADHLVLVECKSGANVDREQAQAYGRISFTDVRRALTLDPGTVEHCVLFVCLEEHEARIRLGLPPGMALLVVGEKRVRLHPEGTKLPPIDVAVPGPPPPIVIVDHDSPASAYDALVTAQLVAAAARQEVLIDVTSIARAIVANFNAYGRAARELVSKRIRECLRTLLAKGTGLAPYFALEKGSQHDGQVVRVLKNPSKSDPRGAPQAWQALQRAARGGKRKKPDVPEGQLDLWGLAQDLEPEESDS